VYRTALSVNFAPLQVEIKLYFLKEYSEGEWDVIEPAVRAFTEIILRKTV
jgi:hypothetical protein